jgi:hypothetical protein
MRRRRGNMVGNGTLGPRSVYKTHPVMVTIAFEFEAPASDSEIAEAVVRSAPNFPRGTFTITAIERDEEKDGHANARSGGGA